jgi:DNA-binding transcriptional ArsR family regulator
VIEFELNVEVMGTVRFAFSPFTEVISSVRLLGDPRPTHLHRPWLALARERLADQDLSLLLALAPPGTWQVDFLCGSSTSSTTLESQLTDLLAVSPDHVRAELDWVWRGREMPVRARQLIAAGARGPGLVAEAIWEYWDVAIAPFWPRMCAVLEDDVAHRAARAMHGGLFDLFADLHPEVSLDDHTLRVDKPQWPDAVHEATQLTLVPSVFIWPQLLVSHHPPGGFEFAYGARGVGRVWEGLDERRTEPHDRLGALLGRGRAAVPSLLATPMSTTQVARTLAQSPASISRHLSVLRESGLVTSRRSGRSVLYVQTPLAESLTSANRGRKARPGRRVPPWDEGRQEA